MNSGLCRARAASSLWTIGPTKKRMLTFAFLNMERGTEVESALSPWQGDVLPLHQPRKCPICGSYAERIYCSLSCSNRARRIRHIEHYNNSPKRCPCGNPIPFGKRHWNTYCSHSCAAKVNNRKRPKKVKPGLPSSWDRTLIRFQTGKIRERKTLRQVLLKLKGDKCEKCQIPAIWQDAPLILIVDHKDGNAGNNFPDNLWLLCPNCNSQTPTFSGRNRGNGRKSRGLPRK